MIDGIRRVPALGFEWLWFTSCQPTLLASDWMMGRLVLIVGICMVSSSERLPVSYSTAMSYEGGKGLLLKKAPRVFGYCVSSFGGN